MDGFQSAVAQIEQELRPFQAEKNRLKAALNKANKAVTAAQHELAMAKERKQVGCCAAMLCTGCHAEERLTSGCSGNRASELLCNRNTWSLSPPYSVGRLRN